LGSAHGFEVPTWNDIYDMLIEMADKVRASGFKPDILIGISRGGWPPTRILSDLLENPCIASVGAAFYVSVRKTNHEPRLTQPLSVSVSNKRILLVDDVADTGKSTILIKTHLERGKAEEIKILTLYYKPWSIVVPDFYGKETSDWIVFPWEIKETLKKLMEEYKEKPELFAKAKWGLIKAGIGKQLIERLINELP
jgi:hypoxanthine phosphoribosyltransferase